MSVSVYSLHLLKPQPGRDGVGLPTCRRYRFDRRPGLLMLTYMREALALALKGWRLWQSGHRMNAISSGNVPAQDITLSIYMVNMLST